MTAEGVGLRTAILALLLLAAAVLKLASPVGAYSPIVSQPGEPAPRSYPQPIPPPSDYEAVDATPRIVVARAQSAFQDGMRFEIEEVLKGEPLKHMHVESRSNSFQAGSLYLTFLSPSGDGWTLSALADQSMQAVEPEDAWLRTVRLFAEISALDSDKQEKEALKELKAAAEEDRSGRYPDGLAKRIGLHLATPTAYKSFSDLMDFYQDAAADDDRLEVLWALLNADHPETAGFFRSLLGEPDWLLQPVVSWFSLNPEELPRIAELARVYLGRPVGQRGLLLYLMLEAAEEHNGPLLWTLLPSSDRGEIRSIAEKVLAWPGLDLGLLAVPEDERVETDLFAVWLEAGTSSQVKERLEALLRKGQDPRWRSVEGLEELAAAFEGSQDRAARRDILLEILDRADDSSHLPVLWRLLLQARDREADLLLEWTATRVPSYEALVDLYRGARSDEEKNQALWVAGAAWRNWQLAHVLAEVGALGPGVARLERLAKAFLSCPSATARSSILSELEGGLAIAQDLPVMLEILRGTDPWEALTLARWFAQHPSPEALPWLKRLPLPAIRGESWMMEALAAAGDPEVLDLAIEAEPEDDTWAMSILAWSPLPAAAEEARRILAERGDSLTILVASLGEEGSSTPWREWFLDEVVRSETAYAGDRQRARHFLQQAASSEPQP